MSTPRPSVTAAPETLRPRAGWAAAVVVLAALAPAAARGQQLGVPQPLIPETTQRDGLITRFTPIEPNLPPDRKRDQWYDTRWGDPPNLRRHPNFYSNGGLYGLPWKVKDTRSYYPYFFGAPGQNTITEDSRPLGRYPAARVVSALVHPFKPVGYYYDQGSYVPLYDLDPLVPGPGPAFFPFFRRITSAGG